MGDPWTRTTGSNAQTIQSLIHLAWHATRWNEQLNGSDLQVDPTDNSVQAGYPLVFTVTVSSLANSSITPISGAIIDIWHSNLLGLYSDEASYNPGGAPAP